MKIINDDNFEFEFASNPPTQGSNAQPYYGPNLPPENPSPAPTCGCPHGHDHGQPNNKNKGLNFYHPDDLNYIIDQVLMEMELQKNTYEITKNDADKELGRPSSPYITEQDILDCIEKGKKKDTPARLTAIEKEKNDPNSPERGEFYKKLFG